jgi:hypothetical protein
MCVKRTPLEGKWRSSGLAMETIVISVDGACSGRRCACAAIAMQDGRLVAEDSRNLPEAGGYVLAVEIAGVSLAARLLPPSDDAVTIIVETDNPDVPRVIERGYRPRQACRIPAKVLGEAIAFAQRHQVIFKLLPRNSTPGLRRAHRVASRQLWVRRRRAARR